MADISVLIVVFASLEEHFHQIICLELSVIQPFRLFQNCQIVLVETNWVVDVIAPAHLQSPQALKLLERAQAGEFKLYVPAICFAEARETVPRRFAPRSRSANLNIFPLSEKMLERQVSIGSMNLSLKPYDLAVLAAVIVKSEELLQEGHPWTCFCELDSDLQPWDKSGARKPNENFL